MKDNDLKHITRMDYPNKGKRFSPGWWVRFWRKDYKTGKIRAIAQKSFYDSQYGSDEAKSLAAAKKWRDRKKREVCADKPFHIVPRPDNKSGVVGVFFAEYYSKRDKRIIREWVASWNDENGKPKRRSFSVKKWGYNEAFRMAVDTRREAERYLMIIKNDGDKIK
jgi:hypothetical protein